MALPLTAVPQSFIAGDTFDVVLGWSDYPAPTYSAALHLTGYGLTSISVSGAAYGAEFRFLLSGGSTASWAPGAYNWAIRVSDGSTQVTTATGKITVQANPAEATSTTDTRSHARRTLDLIQSAIEGRVPDGVDSYNIDGRSITSIPLRELFTLREKYQGIVNAEEAKAAGKSGLRVHRTAFRRV